jgi:hypothetical protein
VITFIEICKELCDVENVSKREVIKAFLVTTCKNSIDVIIADKQATLFGDSLFSSLENSLPWSMSCGL